LLDFFSFQRLARRGRCILFFLLQVNGADFFGHKAFKNRLAEIALEGGDALDVGGLLLFLLVLGLGRCVGVDTAKALGHFALETALALFRVRPRLVEILSILEPLVVGLILDGEVRVLDHDEVHVLHDNDAKEGPPQ
jgi:hypothetical protein